jgi:acyl-CoA reductase-like NAD-dependent aldehyde dehydrogenase
MPCIVKLATATAYLTESLVQRIRASSLLPPGALQRVVVGVGGLFVDEVVREMTVKAGQKCTAIRRAIVPQGRLDAVAQALRARLAAVVTGDSALERVEMGALASRTQVQDVGGQVARLSRDC